MEYVYRWVSITCPVWFYSPKSACPKSDQLSRDSRLLFTFPVTVMCVAGVTGGGRYNHHGGSANYVCLPLDPDYDYQGTVTNNVHSLMYGTEYEDLSKWAES
jgi:hypothetical protein